MKKLIAILLLVCLLVSAVACGKDPVDDPTSETTGTQTNLENPSPGDVTVFKKSDVTKFKLVYPADLAPAVVTKVEDFEEQFNSALGVAIVVTTDEIDANNKYRKEWDNEILIGMTNRDESAAFGANYSDYDYGYGYKDGKILIYSKTDAYLIKALETFYVNVVFNNKNSDVFYQSDWTYFKAYEATAKKLTVNGVEIGEYEIFVPSTSDLFEVEIAQRLQSCVLEKTGHKLAIKTDNESRGTENAIFVGKTSNAGALATATLTGLEGCLKSDGKDIALCGDTMTGLVNASKKLTSVMFDTLTPNTEHAVTVEGETKVQVTENTYSVASFNVCTKDYNDEDARAYRATSVINNILTFMPDTVGFQEPDQKWMATLREKFSEYYEIVGVGRNDGAESGSTQAIMYSKERFNLIETQSKWLSDTPNVPGSKLEGSQYIRMVTWVLLEDKETGARFVHANTHIDVWSSGAVVQGKQIEILLKSLADYNDMPLVMTADWNTNIHQDTVKYLLNNGMSSVYDCPELADTITVDNMGDFALVTGDCMKIVDHVYDATSYNGEIPSDHPLVYYEIALQLPANGEIDHGWETLENDSNPKEWLDLSNDKDGATYKNPVRLDVFDLGKLGRFEIPTGATTVEIIDKTYVVIRTVEELNAALAADSAHTNNYILDADLDYTGKTFNAITIANGIFDGNGHTMYGYSLEDTGTFATVDADGSATVRNLTIGTDVAKIVVTDTRTELSTPNTDTIGSGAVFGSALGTVVIENVTVYAEITSKVHTGGFVGQFNKSLTIRNSTFYGSVNKVGKLTGYFGGFIGIASQSFEKLKMEGCVNYGTVAATDTSYAGGMVGYTRNRGTTYDKETLTLIKCVNYGSVVGKHSGGMIGCYQDTDNNIVSGTITGCLNVGAITGTTAAGGLIGHCYARHSLTIKDCANIGVIRGTKGKGAGGWIASIDNKSKKLKIENCASFGTVDNVSISNLTEAGVIITVVNSVETEKTSGIENANITTCTDAGACVEWLNTNMGEVCGPFILGNAGTNFVPVNLDFVAVQQGTNGGLRLIGKLGDSLRFKTLGFEITPEGGTATKQETTNVYRKVSYQTDAGSADKFLATDLGGTYAFMVELNDVVPAQGTVTLNITAYAIGLDGTTVYNGTTYQATFTDGVLVAVTVATA